MIQSNHGEIEDPEVDNMHAAFQGEGRTFYVVENTVEGIVYGCGGFAPLAGGGHPDTCELQKMYFLPQLRGLGLGKKLLVHCIDAARSAGYQKMYLETVNRMVAAGQLYRKMGFEELPEQLGATGHSGCDCFMIREI
ncbi:MAG: GNAT family N-acetyltransferase [Bacteroidota bacterium]